VIAIERLSDKYGYALLLLYVLFTTTARLLVRIAWQGAVTDTTHPWRESP
jgi:hypothetical protein